MMVGRHDMLFAGIVETFTPDVRLGLLGGIAFMAAIIWYNLNFFKFWGTIFKIFFGWRK